MPLLVRPCFFFNDTATTEIYTLSLHDALPIFGGVPALTVASGNGKPDVSVRQWGPGPPAQDRKSTRLNSSHLVISYAVFCLKKKKKIKIKPTTTKKKKKKKRK